MRGFLDNLVFELRLTLQRDPKTSDKLVQVEWIFESYPDQLWFVIKIGDMTHREPVSISDIREWVTAPRYYYYDIERLKREVLDNARLKWYEHQRGAVK